MKLWHSRRPCRCEGCEARLIIQRDYAEWVAEYPEAGVVFGLNLDHPSLRCHNIPPDQTLADAVKETNAD